MDRQEELRNQRRSAEARAEAERWYRRGVEEDRARLRAQEKEAREEADRAAAQRRYADSAGTERAWRAPAGKRRPVQTTTYHPETEPKAPHKFTSGQTKVLLFLMVTGALWVYSSSNSPSVNQTPGTPVPAGVTGSENRAAEDKNSAAADPNPFQVDHESVPLGNGPPAEVPRVPENTPEVPYPPYYESASNAAVPDRGAASPPAEVVQSPRSGEASTASSFVLYALFPRGSSSLSPDAKRQVDAAVDAIHTYSPLRVAILGYTDSTEGSDDTALELGRHRADAVRAFLIQRGINSELLTVSSMGKQNPVSSNDTAEGRARNRWVAIILNRR